MSAPTSRVTWDPQTREWVQWHGRSYEIAQAAAKRQEQPQPNGEAK
ncbi:hypothetical protein ACFYUR_19065 [Micromonospora haikouensis]